LVSRELYSHILTVLNIIIMVRVVSIDRGASEDIALEIKLSRSTDHQCTVSLIHLESD
jgi:hypothetical protein